MAVADSALDPEALAYARGLLKPPIKRENLWGVLAAAGFAAVSAMAFATAMLMAPPATSSSLVMDEAPQEAPAGSERN
jgi:hypothetical protein